MTNPFEAPQTPGGGGPTTGASIQAGAAIQSGLEAMQRNLFPWLAALIATTIAGLLAMAMCILPAFFVIPLVTYGWIRFSLDAVDGQAEFGTVMSGFDRISELFVPMLVILILTFAVDLPGAVFGTILQFGVMAATGGAESLFDPTMFESANPAEIMSRMMSQQASSICSVLVSGVWSAVITYRFLPAIFLVVEHERQPIDAMTEAWSMTETSWPALIGLGLTIKGMEYVGGLLICCCVPPLFAYVLASGIHAAAYRQLVPRA